MSHHLAAQYPAQGSRATLVEVPTPTPGAGEVLIRVKAAAVNPVDHAIRDTGMFIKGFPTIVGEDIAGTVAQTGPEVAAFNIGDRVLAACTHLTSGNQAGAGFQEYVLVPADAVVRIPDTMKFEDAAVIPLAAATASHGLFHKDMLGLTFPSTKVVPRGEKLLVWGAASSVGAVAVQLAVAAGYEVVTTASAANFGFAKGLGATAVFDYKSDKVIEDVAAALVKGAHAFDAIGSEASGRAVGQIVAHIGGDRLVSVRPVPEGILPGTVSAHLAYSPLLFTPDNKDILDAVFGRFFPAALASGQFRPAPPAEVSGQGLEAVDGAVNRHQAGVSAQKIVVTL